MRLARRHASSGRWCVASVALVAACSPEQPAPRPVAFAEIAQTLATNCTAGGCHSRVCPPGGLGLDAARLTTSLLNVRSTQDPGRLRVDPGHPERSYLLAKLEGRNIAPGTLRMPPSSQRLSDEQLALFRDWIAG